MTIHIQIFGRSRSLFVNQHDMYFNRRVYFGWARGRKGRWADRSFSLESSDNGGLQLRIVKGNREQGWRLNGPIQHFERAL